MPRLFAPNSSRIPGGFLPRHTLYIATAHSAVACLYILGMKTPLPMSQPRPLKILDAPSEWV